MTLLLLIRSAKDDFAMVFSFLWFKVD